jgi:hypothetical protein
MGVDIVSTYGPWGFVGLPLFHPSTFAWMLLVNALLLALTAFRVFAFIRRTHPLGGSLPGLWVAAVFLPLTVIPVAEWSAALFCFHVLVIAISVEWIVGKAPTFTAPDAMSAVALGFFAWVKISAWPIVPALMLAAWLHSRKHGLGYTAWFLLGALGGWLGAGQSLMNLGRFLRLALEVIGGYKDGLPLWSPYSAAPWFVAAAIVPLAVLFFRFPPRRAGQWLAFLLTAAVFGQLFQSAFVRADVEHILSNALGLCAIAPLAAAAVLSDRRWRSVLPSAAIIGITALALRAAPGTPYYSRPRAEARSLLALASQGPPALTPDGMARSPC